MEELVAKKNPRRDFLKGLLVLPLVGLPREDNTDSLFKGKMSVSTDYDHKRPDPYISHIKLFRPLSVEEMKVLGIDGKGVDWHIRTGQRAKEYGCLTQVVTTGGGR